MIGIVSAKAVAGRLRFFNYEQKPDWLRCAPRAFGSPGHNYRNQGGYTFLTFVIEGYGDVSTVLLSAPASEKVLNTTDFTRESPATMLCLAEHRSGKPEPGRPDYGAATTS